MKNLRFLIIAVVFISCTEEEDLKVNQCQELSAEFFQLYDPYKEYMDEFDRQVEQGERQGGENAKLSYMTSDPRREVL